MLRVPSAACPRPFPEIAHTPNVTPPLPSLMVADLLTNLGSLAIVDLDGFTVWMRFAEEVKAYQLSDKRPIGGGFGGEFGSTIHS